MGQTLAKCLPVDAKVAIAEAIPDRDVLIAMAERVAAFEKSLAVKKAQKREAKAAKAASNTLKKLRKELL